MKEAVVEAGRSVSRLLQYSRGKVLMVWIRLEAVDKLIINQIMFRVEKLKL